MAVIDSLTLNTEDTCGVRRIEWYMGPDLEIMPDDLDRLEAEGGFMIQPKMDGMWSALEVATPNTLKSRDAKTGIVKGSNAGDIPDLKLSDIFPKNSVFAGELEAASEWAKQQVTTRGFRRYYAYDLLRWGTKDLRQHTAHTRYQMLAETLQKTPMSDLIASRLVLTPCAYDRFRERYYEWIEQGLEGVVVKKMDSVYPVMQRSDGKSEEWFRCKRHVTEDFLLVGLSTTPGGKYSKPVVTGQWGFWNDGKLEAVMTTKSKVPKDVLVPENVGKYVAEFQGWKRFESGALQHAQFSRPRPDKEPEMCRKTKTT